MVEYIATDASGNMDTCSFTVTVADQSAPSISCPADITMSAATGMCTASVSFAATATDNCSPEADISITYSPDTGTSFAVGTTEVTVTAVDTSGNSSSCTFNVTVIDEEAPVFTDCRTTDLTMDASPNSCDAVVMFDDPTAMDNCPGVVVTQTGGLLSGSTFPVGTTIIEYIATDASGKMDT